MLLFSVNLLLALGGSAWAADSPPDGMSAEELWASYCARSLPGVLVEAAQPDLDDRRFSWFGKRAAFSNRKSNTRGTIYVLCADVAGSMRVVQPSTWNLVRDPMAHQAIQVVVRHDAVRPIAVSTDGKFGVWIPEVEGVAPGTKSVDVRGVGPLVAPAKPEMAYAAFILPSLLPGEATVSVASDPPNEMAAAQSLVKVAVALREKAALVTVAAEKTALIELAIKVDALAERIVAAPVVRREPLDALVQTLEGGVKADLKAEGVPLLLAAVKATESKEMWAPDVSLVVPVQASYTGSIRVGVSGLYGAVSRQTYAVGTAADNSDVSVITGVGGPIDVEFVSGYTQFFHRRPVSATSVRVGATAALGVANLSSLEITLLQSLYLGLDLGFDNLSIAPSFVIRKVPSLRDGLKVGQAVEAGATVSEDRWVPGFGLIIYPSPELWRFKK